MRRAKREIKIRHPNLANEDIDRIKESVLFGTVSGQRSAYEKLMDDRFNLIDIALYTGEFEPKKDYYVPVKRMGKVKEQFSHLRARHAERVMLRRWEKVSSLMRMRNPVSGEYIEPVLQYRKNEDQHTYFIFDPSSEWIKIGITDDLHRRLDEVKRDFKAPLARFIHIEYFGGRALEKALHKHLEPFRVDLPEMGREWFTPHKEVFSVMDKLARGEWIESVNMPDSGYEQLEYFEDDFLWDDEI